MFQKILKKVTILGVVKYLAAEINVSGSAYLEYAYLKGESLFLHWYDNEPKDIGISFDYRKFYVESNGHKKFSVSINEKDLSCIVYDYDNKDYQNYIYFAQYENQEIAVCGYCDNHKHYVTKEFENGMMTEYSYEMKKGKYSSKSKTKVYQGEFEYNPKQHFPRKKKENEVKPTSPPADIQLLTEIRDLLKEKNR